MTTHLCTVQGLPCASARVLLPFGGVWLAQLGLVDPKPVSGSVVVALGGLELRGTVDPSGDGTFAGHQSITVRGGGGGWGKALTAKAYHNDGGITRGRLAREAGREVGEVVTVDTTLDTSVGVDWEREAAPASRLLSLLFPSATWWVGTDGVTRVGTRPSFDATGVRVIHFDPDRRAFELRFEGVDVSQVLPGARVADSVRFTPGLTVGDVEVYYDKEGLRACAWEGTARNAIADALRALASAADPARAYHGIYRYRVYSRDGDRVNLQVVNKELRLPDALPVGMAPGVAGAFSTLRPGAVVLVQFVDGDPAQPIIVGFTRKEEPGFVPIETWIDADLVKLGGGSDWVTLDTLVRSRIQQLAIAILNSAPVPNDGGAAIQTAAKGILTGISGWSMALEPPSMGAAKVKAT